MSSQGETDLLGPLFGDPEVAGHLSDRACLQAMLDVEAALVDVEAQLGIVPGTAVTPIRAAAQAALYDCLAIAAEAAEDGNLAIQLVRHLRRQVESTDRDAAGYVHWGATSQDILDTALVLQLQAAIDALLKDLNRAISAFSKMAVRHR